MSVSELSTTAQNYLKVIWNLAEWTGDPVTTTQVATRMGLSTSTVSAAIRRLDEDGLVGHPRYGTVELSEVGRAHALAMVRRHRLIETLLCSVFSYRWDEVHDEAEHLEHAVSDGLVTRIDELLGHPDRDPHGDPIPAADGAVHMPDASLLSEVVGPARVVVERVSDVDPDLLRFLAARRIAPGARLDLYPPTPYTADVSVRVSDATASIDTVALGDVATAAIWVALLGEDVADEHTG